MWYVYHLQENIIREFNLNEIFQKAKKLNKSRGLKAEEQSDQQPEEGSVELHPETRDQEQPTESKKDQWDGEDSDLLRAVSPFLTLPLPYITAKCRVLWN